MNNDEKTILTDDQVGEIYKSLDDSNTNNTVNMVKSESDDNNEIVKSEIKNLVGINEDITEEDVKNAEEHLNNLKLSDNDYRSAFENYDLSDDEANKLLTVLVRYKNGEVFNYYEEMPQKIKILIDGLRISEDGKKISTNTASKILLDSFIRDAQFGRVVDDYTNELSTTMNNMNRDFQDIMKNSINDIYKNIDSIQVENPEAAEKLSKLKESFEKAQSFDNLIEFIDSSHITNKKLEKALNRYEDECFYFNKKVMNDFNIKVPDICKITPIIKKALNGFTENQIKKFVIVYIKSVYNINPNDIYNLIYLYRSISNIASYEFNNDFESDEAKKIFDSIKGVIQKIILLSKEV